MHTFAYYMGGLEALVLSLLTSILDAGEWPAHTPPALVPKEKTPFPY